MHPQIWFIDSYGFFMVIGVIASLATLLAVFYLVFFTAELFSFRSIGGVLLATVCSTLVTTLLALLYQFVFIKKENS